MIQTVQTVITNLEEVSDVLCCNPLAGMAANLFRTTPGKLLRFFSFCLNANVPNDCSVSGARTAEQMQEMVWTYIDDFVCCPECHKPEATLYFEDGQLCGSCQACKEKISLNEVAAQVEAQAQVKEVQDAQEAEETELDVVETEESYEAMRLEDLIAAC